MTPDRLQSSINRTLLHVTRHLLLVVPVVLTTIAFAHEEPNKTLWEKDQSKKTRERISEAGICASTTFRQDVKDGQLGAKVKTIRQEYDSKGQLISISAFADDTISASAVYSYNPSGDMISDVDLSPAGGISEASLFLYDREGRVVSGFSSDSVGKLVARFIHRFNPAKHQIEFIKYGSGDTIEYTITYEYPDNYDRCDYVTAVKKSRGVDTVLMVTKVADPAGRTVEKKVTDSVANKSYSFLYAYGHNDVITAITKILGDGSVETRSHYACNADGTNTEARMMDGAGQLLRVTTFDYEHFPGTHQGRTSR